LSKLLPKLYLDSIKNIDIQKLKEEGIKVFFCDLDNTLSPYDVKYPGNDIIQWVRMAKENGITVYIISNNSKKRVTNYCEKLKIEFIYCALKPLTICYRKACKQLGVKPTECCMIGDQIFTDVWSANKAGVYSILVKKISDKESTLTKFKRRMEKRILERYENERKSSVFDRKSD